MSQERQWFENEELWRVVRPLLFPPESFETARNSLDDLTAFAEVSPPAAVLDLCCGPGRFALPLAEAGFRVTAVDRTKIYLDELSSEANTRKLDIEVILSDMRDFVRPGAFDFVLNAFTSFGYFEQEADDRKVLENICRSLKPGGHLVMDLIGKEVIARVFRQRDWRDVDGIILLEERQPINAWSTMRNYWTVLQEGKRRDFEFDLRLYSARELTSLIKNVGFTWAEAYTSLKKDPYDNKATRLVILARK